MVDRAAARQAAAHGVTVQPLSVYCIEPVQRGALLLGYAAPAELEIRDGVRKLAVALESLLRAGVTPITSPLTAPSVRSPAR